MKLYQIIALQDFFKSVGEQKLPIKTTYKLSKLARRVEEELSFYSTELNKILNEYGKKENGQFVMLDNNSSIAIIPGKEQECADKINELQNLEVDFSNFSFSLQEFENLDITLAKFDLIFPLIGD